MRFASFSASRIAAYIIGALAFIAPFFGPVGCVSADTLAAEAALVSYVDATGTEYRGYVTRDPTLSAEQKTRRFSSIDAAESYAADIRRRVPPTATGGVIR